MSVTTVDGRGLATISRWGTGMVDHADDRGTSDPSRVPIRTSDASPSSIEADRRRLREDPHSLASAFDEYRGRLNRLVAFRMDPRLRGRVDASDVVQDAYLDAAQRLRHYLAQGESVPVWVWLRQIISQRLIEVHRQHLGARMRDAGREVSLDRGRGARWPTATSVCLADHLAAGLVSPSQQVMQGEDHEHLRQALETMDPIDREVLAMRHFEELSNREVAEVLGLSPTAASNRYVRALKRLKEILTHDRSSRSRNT